MTQPRKADGSRAAPFDLVVIGGGINGAGIARDAAKRGLSVALFEQRDLSTGATWASSGMIHGGLRYLSSDPDVTRLACLDSGYIQKIAPHLIFRIPFLMPWRDQGPWSRFVFQLAEIYFETYDRYQPLKRGQPHTRMTADEARAVEPGIRSDIIGALSMDEWGIDSQRITIINALDAARHGAALHTWTRVVGLLREDNRRVCGVRVHDRIDGHTRDVFARAVCNATGPWATQFARNHGVDRVRVRPGKGVHLIYAGRLTNYAIVAEAIDGRQIFICPHQNTTLVGTTDDDYYGDLEAIPVTHDEVEYLISGVETVFPTIRDYPLIGTTVGCRATLHAWGPTEDALSREHQIWDHTRDGFAGLWSLAGGKLASYRVMAEETTDAIARSLGNAVPCRTHVDPLPGGQEHDLDLRPFAEHGVDPIAATRILYRHGADASHVLDILREDSRTRAVVDPCEPVTDAELRHVLRTEHVRTMDDLKRRCRFGIGQDGGMRGVVRAAQIFCEELDLPRDAVPELVRDFLQNRWEDRRGITPSLREAGEELTMTSLFLSGRAIWDLGPSFGTADGGTR